MAALHQLCWDYRAFLLTMGGRNADVIRVFYPEDDYAALLDRFEDIHRPPLGQMRLVMRGDVPVGCGMIQTFAPGDAEIKRVFISDAARGTGAGRALVETLIQDCRDLGFSRILMDTGAPLIAAQRLYDKLGFVRRGPYQPVPDIADGILVFFEMDLRQPLGA